MKIVNDPLLEGPVFSPKTGELIHPHFFAHLPGCYRLKWRKTVLQGDMVYLCSKQVPHNSREQSQKGLPGTGNGVNKGKRRRRKVRHVWGMDMG